LVFRWRTKLNRSAKANKEAKRPVCMAPRMRRLMMVSVLRKPVRDCARTKDKITR
jgi:hypothetical protein